MRHDQLSELDIMVRRVRQDYPRLRPKYQRVIALRTALRVTRKGGK